MSEQKNMLSRSQAQAARLRTTLVSLVGGVSDGGRRKLMVHHLPCMNHQLTCALWVVMLPRMRSAGMVAELFGLMLLAQFARGLVGSGVLCTSGAKLQTVGGKVFYLMHLGVRETNTSEIMTMLAPQGMSRRSGLILQTITSVGLSVGTSRRPLVVPPFSELYAFVGGGKGIDGPFIEC